MFGLVAKTIGRVLLGASIEAVVTNVIKASLPASTKLVEKIVLGVGGLAITTVISGMFEERLAKTLGMELNDEEPK